MLAYSTGNPHSQILMARIIWCGEDRKMETRLRALGQWEGVTGGTTAPIPVDPFSRVQPTQSYWLTSAGSGVPCLYVGITGLFAIH